MERLLGRGPQLVQQYGAQAGAFGAVVERGAGVGEDEFAQQGGDGEDGRLVEGERVVGGGQSDEVQVQFAVGLVGVDGAGRDLARVAGATQVPVPVVTVSTPRPA